jgi:hypothetical protein
MPDELCGILKRLLWAVTRLLTAGRLEFKSQFGRSNVFLCRSLRKILWHTPPSLEPKSSLPCPQEIISIWRQMTSVHTVISMSFSSILILSSHRLLCLQSFRFPSGCSTKILHLFYAMCFVNFILLELIIIIFGEEWELRSSPLCNFLQPWLQNNTSWKNGQEILKVFLDNTLKLYCRTSMQFAVYQTRLSQRLHFLKYCGIE